MNQPMPDRFTQLARAFAAGGAGSGAPDMLTGSGLPGAGQPSGMMITPQNFTTATGSLSGMGKPLTKTKGAVGKSLAKKKTGRSMGSRYIAT